MTPRRLLRATFLCILVFFVLAACTAAEQSIEVVLTGQPELYESVVDQFRAVHPDIKVDYRTEVFGTWQEKLSILLASDLAPDVFILSWAYFGEFADLGVLLDIGPLVERDYNAMRGSDIIPAAWEAAKYNGRQLGIPFLPGHTMIFYNKDMLADASVAEPKADWTWDEFVEIARKTTQRGVTDEVNSKYAIDHSGIASWNFWSAVLFSHGGSVWNKAGTGFAINSEAGLQAFQFIDELANRFQVLPPRGLSGLWSVGRLTFTNGSSAVLNNTRKDQRFDFAVTNYPAGPAGQFNTGGILPVCAKADTKQPEAAWTFMKYLLSPECMEYRAGYGQLPVRASVVRRLPDPYIREFASGISSAVLWTNKYYNQLNRIMNTHVNSIVNGQEPVSNALTNLEIALNAFLQSQTTK
ncbi:MAG: ABC transporter substrate-binding protein [Limnochordia bacterium]